MKLGDLIKEYRENHGYSQRQFAIMCDLSNGYISMLEKGENPSTKKPVIPSLSQLKKLADGMGLSLMELMENVDDMPVEISTKSTATDTNNAPAPEAGNRHTTPIDDEIINLVLSLPDDKKAAALDYIRYLSK